MTASRLLPALGAAALLLAVGAFLVLRAEAPSAESIASDGLCRAPLRALCPATCPSYDTTLQRARTREPLLFAEAGTCGNLRWISWSSGFDGETAYFGARGELVAAETWKDYGVYCTGQSRSIVYGERIDCQRVTTLTLKERTSEAAGGSP